MYKLQHGSQCPYLTSYKIEILTHIFNYLEKCPSDFDKIFRGCSFDPKNQKSAVKTNRPQTLFTKSAVCLQNTFLPITSQPLNIEKIYLAPDVLHPQPVIWYVYIFFICQLFVYFFAPDVSTAIIRTFQTSFF